jgi:hypothetical protein
MKKMSKRSKIIQSGGYYCKSRKVWVLPSSWHNCAFSHVESRTFDSLTEAYEALDDYNKACEAVQKQGNDEVIYLRKS